MSKFGGGSKCPVCGKSVYMAEEVLAEGNKYHKLCFKCMNCGKMLETTNVTTHGADIYCKSCHSRQFGIKGYGYEGGAGTLASEGPDGGVPYSGYGPGATGGGGGGTGGVRCPRCNGRVYEAEKIVGAGNAWHKSCFSCAECKKKLDSTTVCDNEGQIYCKACYGKQFGPKGVGFGQGAGTLTCT